MRFENGDLRSTESHGVRRIFINIYIHISVFIKGTSHFYSNGVFYGVKWNSSVKYKWKKTAIKNPRHRLCVIRIFFARVYRGEALFLFFFVRIGSLRGRKFMCDPCRAFPRANVPRRASTHRHRGRGAQRYLNTKCNNFPCNYVNLSSGYRVELQKTNFFLASLFSIFPVVTTCRYTIALYALTRYPDTTTLCVLLTSTLLLYSIMHTQHIRL